MGLRSAQPCSRSCPAFPFAVDAFCCRNTIIIHGPSYFFRYRRQLLDRAFNRSEADRKEEQRLTAELAAISKELATVQKDVKSRYGLEDEIESAFDIQNEVEVSKVAQLPSYVYVGMHISVIA